MVARAAPPPLTPMSKETTPIKNNDTQTKKLGLGSALAALGGTNRVRNKNNLYLEEPMEEGLGVGQFDNLDSEVMSASVRRPRRGPREKRISLPGVEPSPSQGGQPRRASLVERSRHFQDKFVKFMQDYSTYTDIEDVEMEEGVVAPLEESDANNFPTRETDLRHVDQRNNLMEASSKRHDYYYDEEEDEPSEEEDVYANYTEGYTESQDPTNEKPSISPGMEIFVQETTGGEAFPHLKKHTLWERYRPSRVIRWTIIVLLFVVIATWLLMTLNFFTNNHTVGYTDVESASTMSPADTAYMPQQPGPGPSSPGTSPGETYQRKHDLQMILEEELFPEAHQDADLLDPNSSFAKKAVEWMTTYDYKSKTLLDQYHAFTQSNRLESSETEEYEDGKDRFSVHENFDDPKHHYKTKIVDRYVEGVYYFKGHPDRSPATAILE